jgi:hypothetical protein
MMNDRTSRAARVIKRVHGIWSVDRRQPAFPVHRNATGAQGLNA